MDEPYVQVIQKDGIAYVNLNRPETCNSLNFESFKQLDVIIKQLSKDQQLRAVVLAGKAGNFSSGLDVKSVSKSPLQMLKLLFKWFPGQANLAQRVCIGWRELPVPVIAVIEGHCYGGGMQIALGADFRIASPTASLSIMEAKWGLVPDMGGLATLRELMPKDQAMLLSMSAKVLSADEALALGLITRISPEPLTAATALAESLMQTSPDANAAIKLNVNRSWSASLRRLLARESWSQIRLLVGSNRKIAAKRQLGSPKIPYQKRQSGW